MNRCAKLRPQERLHVALDDLDFSWMPAEVERFRRYWAAGRSVYEIAERLGRDADEVALLAMDQARSGVIEKRPGGAWGCGAR